MVGFPFSAVVAQERLQLALVLTAISPGIGGVLVRGQKGTAKTTVVRGLAPLLPETDGRRARLVELPIGATEDRVVGSIDLESVLRDGRPAYKPGLLVSAHGGVLYVDEVNLLPDHLVDVLLDAAATGRLQVERDGVSHTETTRFVLVGTMNPEEGELRPQLLDRFGLTVDVAASTEVADRVEVMRRRIAFDADPEGFADEWRAADEHVAAGIRRARARLDAVILGEEELRRIAAICVAFDVEGMRADLVMARTATAHAALRGADAVGDEDIRVAAELALPHRRRRDPFDEPGLDEEKLERVLDETRPDGPEDPEDPDGGDDPDPGDGGPRESEGGPGPAPGRPERGDDPVPERPAAGDGPEGRAATPVASFRSRRIEVPGVGEGIAGRRSRAVTRSGHFVRPVPDPRTGLHVPSTVMSAVGRGGRPQGGGRLELRAEDLRGARREGREGNLVVFVVDASGSMAARDRLSAVTGAIVSLLRDAYQRRDKVAVVTLRGADATVALPATSSVDAAMRRLDGLRTGGRTPLAEGILRAHDLIRREALREPTRRALMVLLTDGRATAGPEALARARRAAGMVAADAVATVVLDCESGHVRLGLAADLASRLGAPCIRLHEISAESVAGVVRAA